MDVGFYQAHDQTMGCSYSSFENFIAINRQKEI